jgi:hypothetical protein
LALLLLTGTAAVSAQAQSPPKRAQMAGYLLAPNEKVSQEFDAGFSLYAAAWPLLERYPGQEFQSGLFGTWMHPFYAQRPAERLYSDIEGGLGWWRDTRFATETPKFIMGGVALNFSAWANGPGAGKGRDWDKPRGKYAVVQLSSRLLWPPDGLNLRRGTCGELFGYGYLPLPLTDPQKRTAGQDVPTGNQCWTLFINSKNFKGPATFFAPFFWSRPSLERPELAGKFLDARPSNANRALQMETQFIPAAEATDQAGNRYARVARTLFPENADRDTLAVHAVTSYRKAALWEAVEQWFAGGAACRGKIDPAASVVHRFPGRGAATWRIHARGTPRDKRKPLDWEALATPAALDEHSFGYRWNQDVIDHTRVDGKPCVVLPEYFKLAEAPDGQPQWMPVSKNDLPEGLAFDRADLQTPGRNQHGPYVTPEQADSVWKQPGPAAGPFKAYPGDGSEVTYYWYRFADQPALLNADLTPSQRERLQRRVEKIHRHWKIDQTYLPDPSRGELAHIDPALVVTPPDGLGVGYVPIVTRQGRAR